MPSIRATCPECGDIELKPDDITVMVNTVDNSGTYSFNCPGESHPEMGRIGVGIGRVVLKAAEPLIVNLLVGGGCEIYMIKPLLPDFLPDPSAPSIEDAAIDMHFATEKSVWKQAVKELKLDASMQT
jgi:hypothetical protein